MQAPRILIFALEEPEGNAGSGVILRGLLEQVPASQLLWVSLWRRITGFQRTWRPEVPREGLFPLIPGRFSWIQRKLVQKTWRTLFPKLAHMLLGPIIRRFQPQVIWSFSDRDLIVALGKVLPPWKGHFHFSLHDDPEVFNRLYPPSYPYEDFRKAWLELFSKCQTWDAISQGMMEAFADKTAGKGVLVTRGISRVRFQERLKKKRQIHSQLNLVIGGFLDCSPPWPDNLLKALRIVQGHLGFPVRLFAFDHTFPQDHPFSVRKNYVPPEEYENFLDDMHIGIAGDCMGKERLDVVRYSFSTKVLTYICHGLPVLYYGYTSFNVGRFLQLSDTGIAIENSEPEAFAGALLKLVDGYSDFVQNCLHTAEREFIQESVSARFWKHIETHI